MMPFDARAVKAGQRTGRRSARCAEPGFSPVGEEGEEVVRVGDAVRLAVRTADVTETPARGLGCHLVQITSKRLARASGALLSPASRPFSTQISSAREQIGLSYRETGVILLQNGPAA
jgi:hypothetical protein